MTTDPLKTVILEAVDCLRQRKCRPDRESIAVYVMRKLGSSMNEIFSEIENTVDLGLLLKVEYKGSTSYRSPKNFDLKNSPLLTKHSKILNSSKTTRYVISGMNELLSSFSHYSQMGVPYEELKKKLVEFDVERFTEAAIKVIFEREEGAGTIQVAQSDDPLDPIRIFPKDLRVPDDMKLITFAEETNETSDRKKKKRSPKKDGDATSNNTEPSSPSLKKEKQVLVYAVKSDPHKLAEASLRDEESVKAKVEQISSIGLKVISEKGAIRKAASKSRAKNGVGAQKKTLSNTTSNDVSNVEKNYDRKPSLALVTAETAETAKANGSTDNKSSEAELEVRDVKPVLSNKIKVGKRKNDTSETKKTPKSGKPKKLKVDTSNKETDEPVVLPRNPPRYTYSSKKRTKEPEYVDNDDSMEKIFKKISKGDSVEAPVQAHHSNGHLSECAYCKQEKNAAGDSEDFLSCGTCNAKIHPSCVAYSEDHAKRLRVSTTSQNSHLQWQCFSCKRCGVCQKALMAQKSCAELKKTKVKISKKNEQQRYILCDHCDRGYHVKCISGSPSLNESSWHCGECIAEKVTSSNENPTTKTNISPKKSKALAKKPTKVTPVKKKGDQLKLQSDASKTKAKSQNGNKPSSSSEISPDSSASVSKSDEEVPDISGWTPAQVQKYFTGKGLQDEASSLREQEIDGMSLLLLRRADVIFGLNLRLGPALKIYRLVCQLQQHASALKKKESQQKTP